MTTPRLRDMFCNVLLPIIMGYLFYLLPLKSQSLKLLKNYLPDGLWAYAFFSCVLVIWGRHINFSWIFITVLTFAAFEFLQSKHIINGTGDIFDFVIYLIFGGIALSVNKYFFLKFRLKPKSI